jgi:hypothetical protein
MFSEHVRGSRSSTRTWRFLPLICLPVAWPCGSSETLLGPLFAAQVSAIHALAVDDGDGWAGVAVSRCPTFNIQRLVDAIECAVVRPAACRGGKSSGSAPSSRARSPASNRCPGVHQAINDLRPDDGALVAAASTGRNQRPDPGLIIVRQIAGIMQLAAVVATSTLDRPYSKLPANRLAGLKWEATYMFRIDTQIATRIAFSDP